MSSVLYQMLIISSGASAGACLRWGLGLACNPIFPTMPLGTLLANLSGGFLIGLLLPLIMQHSYLSSEMRLFLITGFLGSLTTFSSFSAEMLQLLMRQRYEWMLVGIGLHVIGTLSMTLLGIFTMKTVKFLLGGR
jgi:CrcB protein